MSKWRAQRNWVIKPGLSPDIMETFKDSGLHPQIVKGVEALGFIEPGLNPKDDTLNICSRTPRI